jgi:hypothetical protein
VPIILASDKTRLGNFCGNKQAWPVYMTIGNICKDIRKKVSSGASILIGYLPVTKLECFKKASRSKAQADLFHFCMQLLVAPLRKAGSEGIPIGCSDGFTRWCHLVLAAYVADNPEQCLVAGVKQNRCHVGTVPVDQRGDFAHCPQRDPKRTANDLRARLYGTTTSSLLEDGLSDIDTPFWADLPFCNIFQCLTPDLLHQFHRGVFADHILEWAMTILGKAEFDRRYTVMPLHDDVRHFGSGISELSQTNGTEQKEIEKEFVAAVHGSNEELVEAAAAALDLISLSSLPSHTAASISAIADAISRFHAHKHIFIELGGRLADHFNLNKLHSLIHWPEFIVSHGSLDGYNTEWSERLHIDLTKDGYRATNHIAYTGQMAAWLGRREKVAFFDAYLDWVRVRMPGVFVTRTTARSRKAANLQSVQGYGTVFQFAAGAPWPRCSVHTLQTTFGCHEILPAMARFLDTQNLDGAGLIRDDDQFEVFTRVDVKPQPGRAVFGVSAPDECIRAGPSPDTTSRSAPFDTVLVHRQAVSSGAAQADNISRTFALLCCRTRLT